MIQIPPQAKVYAMPDFIDDDDVVDGIDFHSSFVENVALIRILATCLSFGMRQELVLVYFVMMVMVFIGR